MLKTEFLIALFLGCFFINLFPATADDTCPNTPVVNGDMDMWSTYVFMKERWYRDMFASFYNLPQGDWDGGWGWSKYNNPDPYAYEFCKMMSSGRLLWGGLDDTLNLQGTWKARTTPEGATATADPYPQPSILSRTEGTIDFFHRNSYGWLKHMHLSGSPWYPGDFPPDRSVLSVSDLVATEKEAYRIESNPVAVSRTADTMDVLARGYDHDLLHFQRTSSGAWSVENVTALMVRSQPIGTIDRYFIYSNPVVRKRTNDVIDVFALDNFRHLIHYCWDSGAWIATDIQQIVGDAYRIAGDPVVYSRGSSKVDVFGRNLNGHLIHFSWSYGSGWSAENVSDITRSRRRIEGKPSVVSELPANTLNVFVRSAYRLILYYWAEGWGWLETDLTTSTGSIDVIEGDPTAISRSTNTIDVFARGMNHNLVHYYFVPGSFFNSENLTERPGPFGIVDDPVVFSQNPNRIDVFGRSLANNLVHYYWAPESGWRAENVHLSPDISSTCCKIGSSPVVVQRSESALDVFAGGFGNTFWTAHFTSAIGLTINSWHTNKEYSDWAAGSLHDFKYTAEDSDEPIAGARRNPVLSDRVAMMCPSFQQSPAERAATMLHEATHMNFWPFEHQDNPPGSICTEPCSDNWYFHGVRDPAGALNASDQNHSMNQLIIEYLCDISEFAGSDVPHSAYLDAQNQANNNMSIRILNPPGWTCGIPRPLY